MDLEEYRKYQRVLVRLRDDNTCQYCRLVLNLTTYGDQIHHVYGRSRNISESEYCNKLITLCDRHHRDVESGKIDDFSIKAVCKKNVLDPVNYTFIRDFMLLDVDIFNDAIPVDRKNTCHTCIDNNVYGETYWLGSTGFCPRCLKAYVLGD